MRCEKNVCSFHFVVALASLLGACGGPVGADQLAASLEAYEGATLTVEGEPSVVLACTEIACSGGPCNSCAGRYVFGDPGTRGGFAVLVPAEGWSYPTIPGASDPTIGCLGDEAEVQCAPAVPSRIESAHGTLRRGSADLGGAEWLFEVDSLELADTPHDETVGDIHLVEVAP